MPYRSEVKFDDFEPETRRYFLGRTVAVCGGSGFIGSHVVEQLLTLGATPIVPTRRQITPFLQHLGKDVTKLSCDLDDLESVQMAFRDVSVVMDLAAKVGGVKYNEARPASLFEDNLRPFLNTMRAAVDNQVSRFLVTSSACVYRRDCPIPASEIEGFVGIPESTNLGYGWAKRMEEFMGWAAAQEFDLDVAIARPYNAYGPRDDFRAEHSHVIPALVLKAFRSTDGSLPVWGDGTATRSFLYVDDFARGLLEITARYDRAEAINLGGDDVHSIRDIAAAIASLVSDIRGIQIVPEFGAAGPVGQTYRGCDTSKLKAELAFQPKVTLEEGLRKTIDWYATHEDCALHTHAQ